MRRSLTFATALATMAWLGHCSGSDVGPAQTADAGRPDSARDTGFVYEPDSKDGDASPQPTDAAYRDIERPETGVLTGVWKEIPGIPNPNCLMAEDPNASVGPLQFQPCANNRAGCKKMKNTWSNKRSAISFGAAGDTIVRKVAGKLLLQYQREYAQTDYVRGRESIIVVQELKGLAVTAIYKNADALAYCGLSSRSLSKQSAYFRGGTLLSEVILRENLSTRRYEIFDIGDTKLKGPIGATDTHVFVQTDSFNHVIYDTRSKEFLRNAEGVIQIPFSVPLGVTGGAFGMSNIEPGVMFGSENGSYALVTKSAPKFTTAIAIDDDDNQRMYWVESDDIAPAINPVLYTAPFSRNAAELAANGGPRRVTALRDTSGQGGTNMIANGGLVLDSYNWNQAQLIRASDGKAWRINAEPGEYFSRAMWVDDQEVWMVTAVTPPGEDPSNGIWESGILVIDRASLGEPTVLPQ
jgi:hypothetical protein